MYSDIIGITRKRFIIENLERVERIKSDIKEYIEYRQELEEICDLVELEIKHDIIAPEYQASAAAQVDGWTEDLQRLNHRTRELKLYLKDVYEVIYREVGSHAGQ